jgi:GDPmannose 4,6-dehydratase
MKKIALITGVNGQDGTLLANFLLSKSYEVYGTIRNSNSDLWKLKKIGIDTKINLIPLDLTSKTSVENIISELKPDEIYNLAAVSSVAYSFENPYETILFNSLSIANLLESIRILSPKTKFFQATSSEMYGNIKSLPVNENSPFDPISPYAITKVYSSYLTKLYRNYYKLFCCTGILFNHESFLRDDNFFVRKIIKNSVEIKIGKRKNLIVGNLNVKRDFGSAEKYIETMYLMLQLEEADDYVISSGSSLKLLDIVYFIFDFLKLDRKLIIIDKSLIRSLDLYDIYGDSKKARTKLHWNYDLGFLDLIKDLIKIELSNHNVKLTGL